MFEQRKRKRLVFEGFLVSQNAGDEPRHGIDDRKCCSLSAGEDIVADRQFYRARNFDETLVDPFVVTADKDQVLGGLRKFYRFLLIKNFCAAGAVWGGRGRDKTLCLVALLAYQASDAFSNAFFARYQQKGRLDAACRIRFSKIVAFAAVYAAVLAASRSVVAALAAASVAHVALFFATDVPLLGLFGPLRLRLPGRASFSILLACLPLAFNSFLLMYVNNAPRFAVDAILDEKALAEFSALFMVSFVVAVCADFLMNPQVVRLAEAVRAGDRSAAVRTLLHPFAAIALLGAAGLAVAATFGAPLLAWIFGLDLSLHRDTLCVALVGGVLVALYQLGQTVLVVLRKQAWGLPGMVLAAAAARLAARPFVARFGLRGAALSYVLAVLILAAASDTFATLFLRRVAWRSPKPGNKP